MLGQLLGRIDEIIEEYVNHSKELEKHSKEDLICKFISDLSNLSEYSIDILQEDEEIQVKYKPISKGDDLYSIEVFMELCDSGWITDDDGTGYYAFGDKVSNIDVFSNNVDGNVIDKYTHVVWYNK